MNARLLCAALACAFALSACGGGGSDASSSQPNQPNPAPIPAPVPSPTPTPSSGAPLATGDIAIDGRAWINYRRSQAGLVQLAEAAAIDNAALGHSQYLALNNLISHTQESSRPGFTGVTPADRLIGSGYALTGSYAYGEVISAATNSTGFSMAEGLIAAIYHRFVIFEPQFREFGSGAASSGPYRYFTTDFATRDGFGQGLPAGRLISWPYNGQTQVDPNFFSDTEQPDPVPGRNEVGYPISVHANLRSTLAVQSFVVRPRGGAALDTIAVAPEGSPTAASIVPLSPLSPHTVYDVSFSGILDGSPVSLQWSFTTR